VNLIYTSVGIRRENLRRYLIEGAKLVVIDPKRIDIAKRADMWIRPRPQSDGPFAMGLMKVIIEEGLYDKNIVADWTVGFDQLAEHVKTFTLDDVEKVTWVPREQIEKFARLYAKSKPAMIQLGNGLEQGINCMQAIRAVNILRGICGNVNIPGGDLLLTPRKWNRPGRFYLPKEFPRPTAKAVGNEFQLAMKSAYVAVPSLVKAMREGKPYPIKAAWVILSNPLVSYPDTTEAYEAFKKLDFIVVNEIFPTPTAMMADILLPVAWGAEHDTVGYWPGWYQDVRAYPKLVEPPGDALPDSKIIAEVADRLGFGQYFWKDEVELANYMLEPSGYTWEEFKKIRILPAIAEYKKPEEGCFKTPTGKIEIHSQQLADMGYSPMPLFEEVSNFRFQPSEDYPLLMTNGKEEAFMLTGYKHVEEARRHKRLPIVEMHPEVAEKVGLKDGDWGYIETRKGRIKQIVQIDPDLDPRVVFVSFGWWFPEEPEDMFQFRKSNINVLTDGDPPYETMVGSQELRGIPCRLSKVK